MTVANDNALLDRVTTALTPVRGVRALVLGGSRARDIANERSDYDIGLYYDAANRALPMFVASARYTESETSPGSSI